MSTFCSLGQPNNGNPSELKLNLYRTRFGGEKKSRSALCERTTTQRGVLQRFCFAQEVVCPQALSCRALNTACSLGEGCDSQTLDRKTAEQQADRSSGALEKKKKGLQPSLTCYDGIVNIKIRYHRACFLRPKLQASVKNFLTGPHQSL